MDRYGHTTYTLPKALDAIHHGANVTELKITDYDEIKLFNKFAAKFGLPDRLEKYVSPTDDVTEYHHNRLAWKMPQQYYDIDLTTWFTTDSDAERTRIKYELELFNNKGYTDMLKFLIYIVDVMRENNIVWGVGRGSSVASYILFKIGLHKIDSLKYNLDILEFLHET